MFNILKKKIPTCFISAVIDGSSCESHTWMVRGTRSLKRAMWGSSSSQGTMAATACRAVRRTSAELSFRLARNTC